MGITKIVNIDPKDNYREFAMKNPEKIKTEKVSRALRECIEKKWQINRPEFDMHNCAKQYYDYFLKILGK